MELKTLTTEEQIQVLNELKNRLNKIECNNEIFEEIGEILDEVLLDLFNLQWYQYLRCLIIPLFTFENALEYGNATGRDYSFWWDQKDFEARHAFLDWMISELEKQLKD